MIRGTTPSIIMELPARIRLSLIDEAVFSIVQNGKELIQKRLEEMEMDEKKNTLCVRLTQEETYDLKAYREVAMQLKIKIGDDVVVSDIVTACVLDVLNKEVI